MKAMPTLLGLATVALSTPLPAARGWGPEAAGLRLGLAVEAAPAGKYDVRVELENVGDEDIAVDVRRWRPDREREEFKDCLEAAISIESYPAIQPWLGQVRAPPDGLQHSQRILKAGQTLSLKWQARGRHLKNLVANPLEIQNPEFREDGLYSVHASVLLQANGKAARLRSNEQLVPFGGSLEAPKATYGKILWTNEKGRTASIDLGSVDQVEAGDQFLIQTGIIGRTWTLSITRVADQHATGELEPSTKDPKPSLPQRGDGAALVVGD